MMNGAKNDRTLASTSGGLSVLPASVRGVSSVGVGDEEMTKQEYGCTFLYDHVKCRLIGLAKDNKIPCDNWGIIKADIERLERESNAD